MNRSWCRTDKAGGVHQPQGVHDTGPAEPQRKELHQNRPRPIFAAIACTLLTPCPSFAQEAYKHQASLILSPSSRCHRLDVSRNMATNPLVLRSAPPDLALNRWQSAPNNAAAVVPIERVRHFSVPNIVDERRASETDVHLTYAASSWSAFDRGSAKAKTVKR
jgi:hypothetical protein